MLKALLESLEGIESHYHNLYTERDGKFELTGVEGMKTQADLDRIGSALVKERNDHKLARERLGMLGDRKIEDVLTELDRIPELELAAKAGLDEDKIQELLDARLRRQVAPLERNLSARETRINELEQALGGYQERDRIRTIHDATRRAIGEQQGFQNSAIEDVLMYAERTFEIDDTGRVVTRDNVGTVPGIEAAVWLTEMQTKKPHWWGTTQGGGASGSNGAGAGVKNPWSKDNWNLTEQGRILKENRARAEQLARAAGTTIGGGAAR